MPNKVIDLMGQRFGRLTVVGRAPKVGKNKDIRWACICDCGNEHSVIGTSLRKGTIVSCGCYQREAVSARFKTHGLKQTPEYRAWQSMKRRAERRELKVSEEWASSFEAFLADVGQKPSPELELVLIEPENGFVKNNTYWGTRKDNQKQRSSTVFWELNGESKLITEWCEFYDVPAGRVTGRLDRGWNLKDALTVPAQEQKTPEKHGMSDLPEYKIWRGIVERCKPNGMYGKKGIAISDEWKNSFVAFYEDVGSRPSPEHQLDRIAGGTSSYEKGNTRWSTPKENCRNRTNNYLIEFNGETKCLSEWAEIYGLDRCALSNRLKKGWTVERALTEPSRKAQPKTSRKPHKRESVNLDDFPPMPELLSNPRFIDLTGQRFTNVTVLYNSKNAQKENIWICQCDCGVVFPTHSNSLRRGLTTTCGCKTGKKHLYASHGLSNTPEYKVWSSMLDRCKRDPNYVQKGIVVCDEWKESFEVFYNYLKETIGLKPSTKHQLDRLAGGNSAYKPGNVRWATNKENSRNTTKNRLLTYNGKTQAASAWAEEMGIKPATLLGRLDRGWSIEKAITTPIR